MARTIRTCRSSECCVSSSGSRRKQRSWLMSSWARRSWPSKRRGPMLWKGGRRCVGERASRMGRSGCAFGGKTCS
eukprot:1665949-Alexandrium_andersonii.AAC.1